MGEASEAYLASLCRRGFLSLWSYPNPFNDKSLQQRQEGKELCDLLVVFGEDIVIFSDKSCKYPDGPDEQLNWTRWYRRAVLNSADQIYGAERWIKTFPNRVFVDPKCTRSLDVAFPDPQVMRVHRVVVALGAREACKLFFDGGSGSLPISGGKKEIEHVNGQPFYLGNEGEQGKFCHVFDDIALDAVLYELDTISDFVGYLRKKEALFTTHLVIATGEEDLLAHYLTTINNGEHGFTPEGEIFDGLFVDESAYSGLTALPQYIRSKEANEDSYLWDSVIEYFTDVWRRGEVQSNVERIDIERALRLMATPPRVTRRRLATMLIQAVTNTPPGHQRCISVLDTSGDEIAYGVVCIAYDPRISIEEHQRRRHLVMDLYARSLRVRRPELKQALILGVQPAQEEQGNQDLALMDFSHWNDEIEARTRYEMPYFGLGAAGEQFTDYEFPPEPPANQEG